MMNKDKLRLLWKEYHIIVLVLLVMIGLRLLVFNIYTVSGASMDYTLAHDQRVIGMHHTSIERYDIVIVDSPINEKLYIKRVIGLPGETVEYRQGQLYINDQMTEESYLQQMQDEAGHPITENLKVKVPEGQYFILGDNREHSLDSRELGPIEEKAILSEIIFRIWPLSQWGEIE